MILGTKNITCENLQIHFQSRLNFSTAFSTNAVSICSSVGLTRISRIEKSFRYSILASPEGTHLDDLKKHLIAALHDRMTQMHYEEPITTFNLDISPEPVFEVDLINHGRSALEDASHDLGETK